VSFLVCDSYGWILDGICNEIINQINLLSYKKTNSIEHIGNSKNYFLTHYTSLYPFFCHNKNSFKRNVFVLYTHDYYENSSERKRSLYCLSMCKKIFCMNTATKLKLQKEGIPNHLLNVVYGGADNNLLIPKKKRNSNTVGIISNCSGRKNPELIKKVIQKLKKRKFKVIGCGWEKFLSDEENVTIIEHNYSKLDDHYNDVDVFFSASFDEGGPIPLIESMMSNAVPVVTRVGFCPDIINHGKNGFLFDVTDSVDHVISLIEKAFTFSNTVNDTVAHLTWKNFSMNIIKYFE
jgi:glycosyltransferase involved in cell wall biosynthesis